MTDTDNVFEAKAREIELSYPIPKEWIEAHPEIAAEFARLVEKAQVANVAAIASALKAEREEERREMMNLLGMDENGRGLVTVEDQNGTPVNMSHDPYYNLEGALIDLRRQGADVVCIRTIERVQAQLAAVSKRAASIRNRSE